MRCIIHIGTHKTGTTVLQEWLYQNKEMLSQQEIFLSEIINKPNNIAMVGYFQVPKGEDYWFKTQGISTEEEKSKFFENFEENFKKEISEAKKRHHTIIISSEQFHSLLNEKSLIKPFYSFLKQMFKEIQVVCYFREQSEMGNSLYSTALKATSTLSKEEFFNQNVTPENYFFNYYEIANNWSEVFGRENCNFFIYDRSNLIDGDIRHDFITSLFKNFDKTVLNFELKGIERNISLNLMEKLLFRLINQKIPHLDKNNKINSLNVVLKKIVIKQNFFDSFEDNLDYEEKTFSLFLESNKLFFEKYFEGNHSFKKPVLIKKNNEKKLLSSEVTLIILNLFKDLIKHNNKNLIDSDANYLRDIALKFETSEVIKIQDAINLLSLAKRARPDGLTINEKLAKFRSMI